VGYRNNSQPAEQHRVLIRLGAPERGTGFCEAKYWGGSCDRKKNAWLDFKLDKEGGGGSIVEVFDFDSKEASLSFVNRFAI
ncbi:MAG: hypothetical protein J6V06_01840, partial [Clostridia bacterium]|nr:hypothetical protein [Clostridia bacterium]